MLLSLLSALSFAEVQLNSQLAWHQLSELSLDETGYLDGPSSWARSRVILGYQGTALQLEYNIAVEAANIQLFGTESTLGLGVDPQPFRIPKSNFSGAALVLPRAMNISFRRSAFGMRLGVQSFDWGLGILSNSGTLEPRFGLAQQGNVYARASIFSLPKDPAKATIFFAATDYILRDENAYLYAGDRAWQSIAGVRHIQRQFEVGALVGVRQQTDRPDASRLLEPAMSRAFPMDAYGIFSPFPSWKLEGEIVGVVGSTNRIFSEQTRFESSSILYTGGVLRSTVDVSVFDQPLALMLEGGYASGDANSSDSTARNFSFHSDYNVSLLLYDEIIPRLQARSVDRLADPGLSAQPASGLRYAISQGGVHNSMYAQLCATWATERWLVRGGWLHAYSAVPMSDVYQTAMAGGYATDVLGQEAQHRALGNELDLRLQIQIKDWMTLGADTGYFIPNQALEVIDPAFKVLGHLRFQKGGEQ